MVQGRDYPSSEHLVNLVNKKKTEYRENVVDNEFSITDPGTGSLDVHFVNARIFSKQVSGLWPSATLVAEKCKRAWTAIQNGSMSIKEEFDHVV